MGMNFAVGVRGAGENKKRGLDGRAHFLTGIMLADCPEKSRDFFGSGPT